MFDLRLLMFIAPAILLALWAQWRIKVTYAQAQQIPARLTGYQAAQAILDSAGVQGVGIEQVPGHLSDHYDPSAKVLRLSSDVYNDRSMAAVGIAAHEVGHALQDATNYPLMSIRNAAVPMANIGSSMGIFVLMIGAAMALQPVIWAGIALFGAVAFFQVVNLPVEFDASARAKRLLVEQGIVPRDEMRYVNKVLNAAALTYVAATLQAVLTLLYYVLRFTGGGRRDE
jgi:hypothetical protein